MHTFRGVCLLIGSEKVYTTPYHPQGNPVRVPLVHAYKCTRNETTGSELMFSQHLTLTDDLILGTSPSTETHKAHSESVQNLRQSLHESYDLAAESSKRAGERNKLCFDAKARAAQLGDGDRVLVRNVGVRGKHRLADRWE